LALVASVRALMAAGTLASACFNSATPGSPAKFFASVACCRFALAVLLALAYAASAFCMAALQGASAAPASWATFSAAS
jgi:hypothetical protein